ncbi:hypothetical protein PVAND_009168 [Polypedilum vanderplanki]|uniref:Uncharacterized protein n=1 Tax=Polypedilum vanderplanki TaxID=319348 RepID=A0A9J6CCP0_POLVA|nr:hypothetical protein PVAND_009168 [Polypedilum vanderplanki]
MKFSSFTILICCFSIFPVRNSMTIKCNYSMSAYWSIKERDYKCKVQNIDDFTGNRVTIEKAEGNHTIGKSNDDVKFFTITSANLTYFPKNIENVFKNLELIAIWDSNLIELTSEDLRPFAKLKDFYLQGNPIEVIREDLFVHNPNIEVLILENNKISHIDSKALSYLNNLEVIDLKNNVCEFDKDEANIRSEVLEIVKQIEQGQCQSPKHTTSENPLMSQINQRDENLKFNQEYEEKIKKLSEEIQQYKNIINKQEEQLKNITELNLLQLQP